MKLVSVVVIFNQSVHVLVLTMQNYVFSCVPLTLFYIFVTVSLDAKYIDHFSAVTLPVYFIWHSLHMHGSRGGIQNVCDVVSGYWHHFWSHYMNKKLPLITLCSLFMYVIIKLFSLGPLYVEFNLRFCHSLVPTFRLLCIA